MNLKDFTTGLGIISKYYNDSEGYHLGADHDVIYIYPPEGPISEEDVAALRKLEFHQESDDDETIGYDPDESWWAYV
jgi:hypothetical protein